MIRRAFISLLALAPLLPSLPSQAQPGTTTPPRPSLHLLRSDESGVVLELTTPGYEVATETWPTGTFHRLTAPG